MGSKPAKVQSELRITKLLKVAKLSMDCDANPQLEQSITKSVNQLINQSINDLGLPVCPNLSVYKFKIMYA